MSVGSKANGRPLASKEACEEVGDARLARLARLAGLATASSITAVL